MSEKYISQENTNCSNSSEFATESSNKINTKEKKMTNIITNTKDRVALWNAMGMIAIQAVPSYYLEIKASIKGILSMDELVEFVGWTRDSYASYLQVEFATKCDKYSFCKKDYNVVNEIQETYAKSHRYFQEFYKFDDMDIYEILMHTFKQIKEKQTKNVVADK